MLDDNIHYLSLIADEQRDFSAWIQSDCTVTVPTTVPLGLPREFTAISVLEPSVGSTACSLTLYGKAPWSLYVDNEWAELNLNGGLGLDNWTEVLNNFPAVSINRDLTRNSLCISFWVSANTSLTAVDIKISYINSQTGLSDSQTVVVPITLYPNENWYKALGTFNMEYVTAGFTIQIVPHYDLTVGGEKIWIAGLNVGQWSEVSCHEVNGAVAISLPQDVRESIFGPAQGYPETGVRITSAFSSDDDGYVLIQSGKMLSMHEGLPLIYGSRGQESIEYPVDIGNAIPSMIFPAKGFMTDVGKHNDSTFEFWTRIDNRSITPFRIFGPAALGNTDGLYVEEGYLTLRVGKKHGSYYVGKWYRPMLLSIRYSPTRVSLLINGEPVISLTLEESDIASLSALDWVGLYCHQDVFPFEMDCIAVYPYYEQVEVAKKNFIFGQGAPKTNFIDQSHLGETIQFDFPFAKYTVDFKYPDIGRWENSVSTNLNISNGQISPPIYKLPEIILLKTDESPAETTVVEFLSSQATAIDHVSFNQLNGEYGYIYYTDLNQLNELIKHVFVSVDLNADGPIFAIKHGITGSYLLFRMQSGNIEVVFSNYGDTAEILYTHTGITGTQIDLGIDLEKFGSFYSRQLNGFFGSPQALALQVGGFDGESMAGNIYTINFNNKEYTNKYLTSQINGFYQGVSTDFISNNQLCFVLDNGTLNMDINVSSYWKSMLPLSFFAKYVTGDGGQKFFDLDMLQLNIDAVTPTNATKDNMSIKPYVTFQSVDSGMKDLTEFANTAYIVNPRSLNVDNENWETTKFYFVDGVVLYPPKSFGFQNMMLGLHVEFNVKQSLKKSISLRRLEIASVSVGTDEFHNIGTKYGPVVWPFAKSGDAILPKPYNPYIITKESAPYLYLTKDSGIQLLPEVVDYERGIYVPINSGKAPDFKLGAIRMWIRYNQSEFNLIPMKIFELNTPQIKMHAYLIRDFDSRRARLFLLNPDTGLEIDHVKYIQEDYDVYRSFLVAEKWTSISIMFGDNLDIDNAEGQLFLMPGATFQNIGIFEASNEAIFSALLSRKWSEVLSQYADWQAVIDSGIWNQILDEQTISNYFVETSKIYKALIGIESVTIEDARTPVTAKQRNVMFYEDIEFTTFVLRQAEPLSVR